MKRACDTLARMSERTQYAPGTFCWAELSTTDQDGAKSFYAGLLGWESHDMPVPEGGVYSMQTTGHPFAAGTGPRSITGFGVLGGRYGAPLVAWVIDPSGNLTQLGSANAPDLNTPLGKLFVSMLQRFGVATDKFGSGSGTIEGLS